MSERFIESSLTREDQSFEVPLRPQRLDEFVGQDGVRERLQVLIDAASMRGDPLAHCLFSGPPGLGKTTLAGILAKSMQTNFVVTSGAVIDRPADLAGVLTNLQEGDILFIDEIHRLPRTVEEYLYPAMEDYQLDLVIDSGPSARSVQVKLNRFTLIGATTRSGQLSGPMRSRFGMSCRLEFYPREALEKVISRSARLLALETDAGAVAEIARRARGTPRVANNLLRWVRDYAQARGHQTIGVDVAKLALEMLEIDEIGLDEMDAKILSLIIDHHQGGPVGLNTIAVAVGEEKTTIEEVYEPYLIMQGFINRTPRGREATALAYQHLKRRGK